MFRLILLEGNIILGGATPLRVRNSKMNIKIPEMQYIQGVPKKRPYRKIGITPIGMQLLEQVNNLFFKGSLHGFSL